MQSLSERMTLYFDAGFPIIYIETFEEDKAERAVVTASCNREILEWNVRGLFYSKTDEKREGKSCHPSAKHQSRSLAVRGQYLEYLPAPRHKAAIGDGMCEICGQDKYIVTARQVALPAGLFFNSAVCP